MNFPAPIKSAFRKQPGVFSLGIILLSSLGSSPVAASVPLPVRIEPTVEGFTVRTDAQVLTQYVFKTPLGPVFHPVFAPGGHALTRPHPLPEETPSRDHPHHRSLWLAHGKVNGHDFWHGPAEIRHRELMELRSEGNTAVAVTRADWIAEDGELIGRDERIHRFSAPDDNYWILDIAFTFRAAGKEVTLGDDKEGFLALRMTPELSARPPGRGAILNSEGDRGREAWAKRAAWCSYHGPAGEETVGVTVIDHPGNLRHPPWWHVRDYGLFAVNPLGAHAFGGELPGSGDVTLAPGEALTLNYRLVFHRNSPESLNMPALINDFSNPNTEQH